MYFRNYWYAAILESDTGNPKLKTGHDQTVSLFKINRYNCPEVRLCSTIKKKTTKQVSVWVRQSKFMYKGG